MSPHSPIPRTESFEKIMDVAVPDYANDLVIVVDPFSTGFNLALEIQKRGYGIIAVWTAELDEAMKSCTTDSTDKDGFTFFAEVDAQATLAHTHHCLLAVAGRHHQIVACVVGAESGVDYADALSEYLGGKIRTNGTTITSRRDKHIQQELIHAAGLRSCREAVGSKFSEVTDFLMNESFPVVLKPTNGACSDGVKLCQDFNEAKEHFEDLMSKQNVYGGKQNGVLCQEFLRGKEYVIDHVSRDGVHKTCMIWVYDKRPANGSAFVYYGMKPVNPDSAEGKILVQYTRTVLDAIGIQHGPSHGEVMMTADGPCLVEMNCRAHGWNGIWMELARALTGGYCQIDMAADAFLCDTDDDGDDAFTRTPDVPKYPFQASGEIVMLVSHSTGEVKQSCGYEVLQSLPSFVLADGLKTVGSRVVPTIDLMSAIGTIVVMHPDPEVVQRDLAFIRHMEIINGFFTFKEEKDEENRINPMLPCSVVVQQPHQPVKDDKLLRPSDGLNESSTQFVV